MKKSTLLFAATCLLSGSMAAQPTLQMNVLPNIGDVVTFHEADTTNISEGNAGANQTWNFSGLQPASGVPAVEYYYLAPASTPYASSFPTANYAVKIDADTAIYGYAKRETNQYSLLGIKNQYIEQQYPNPDIQLKTPLALNGNFLDDFTNYTDAGTGIIFYGKGSRKVTYDAYGTLTTPAGTFQNAMRIKSISTQTDSASFFGSQIINHTEITTYDWFAANKPGALVSVYYTHTITETIIPGFDTLVTDEGVVKSVNYIDDLVTGVFDRPGEITGVTIQLAGPNPAVDLLKVNIVSDKDGRELQLLLTDASGRMLETRSLSLNGGENAVSVETAGLPAGIYFLSLTDGQQVSTIPWQRQ